MMSKSIIRLLWLKLNLFSSVIKSYPSLTLLGVESHVSFPFRAMQTVSIDHTCQGLTAVTIESRGWVGRWAGGAVFRKVHEARCTGSAVRFACVSSPLLAVQPPAFDVDMLEFVYTHVHIHGSC